MINHFPPTPALLEVQTTSRFTVLRRQKTGESSLGTPQFVWETAAVIMGGFQSRSGAMRMMSPGLTPIFTGQFFTQYALASDGGLIVREKDIIVDDVSGEAYLVDFVADEADAHLYLTADLRHGVLNELQNLGSQG